jgi:integrase
VWRVTGTIRGERIDKRFPTKGEAKAFAEAQELARTAPVGRHTIDTHLSYPEIHDAEHALELLDGKGKLTDAINFFNAHYVDKGKCVTMKEAFDLYTTEREFEVKAKLIELPTFRTSGYRVARFVNWVGEGELVTSFNTKTIEEFLRFTFTSQKTYENIRGSISHFCKWLLKENYIAKDWVLGVTSYGKKIKKARGVAETISAETAESLLREVEQFEGGKLVPFVVLALFCGLRPDKRGESGKLDFGLHVNIDAGEVTVTPEVSKVDELRYTPIPENALAWLRKFQCAGAPAKVNNFQRSWDKVRAKFDIPHDGLRHSAITYYLKLGNSMEEAAEIFGNSETIIRKHYRDASRTKEEAERFFSIHPSDDGGA